jgi:hypothetical protein
VSKIIQAEARISAKDQTGKAFWVCFKASAAALSVYSAPAR